MVSFDQFIFLHNSIDSHSFCSTANRRMGDNDKIFLKSRVGHLNKLEHKWIRVPIYQKSSEFSILIYSIFFPMKYWTWTLWLLDCLSHYIKTATVLLPWLTPQQNISSCKEVNCCKFLANFPSLYWLYYSAGAVRRVKYRSTGLRCWIINGYMECWSSDVTTHTSRISLDLGLMISLIQSQIPHYHCQTTHD